MTISERPFVRFQSYNSPGGVQVAGRPGWRLSPSSTEESVAQPGPESPHVVDLAVGGLPGLVRPGAAGGAGAVLGTVGPRPPCGRVVGRVARRVSQPGLQWQSLLSGAGGVTWGT